MAKARTKNRTKTGHTEDAPRLRLVDQKIDFASITGGSLGPSLGDIDLKDGPSVWRVAQRTMRYDPPTGWVFWSYLTAVKNATLEQMLVATRATFFAGPGNKTGYINVGNARFTAARVVWLLHHKNWPSNRLRHVNGDPSDDRIENLSDQPKPKVRKAREFKRKHPVGVCTMGPNHWQAYATFNCQRKFLGKFKTQEEAVAARARYDAGQDLF